MTASLLKTASAVALFAALGIGPADAQVAQSSTRQIVVEPAQAAAAQAPAEAAPAQDPAASQASPAPDGSPSTAEPPAPQATASVPTPPSAAPAPVAKPIVRAVVKESRPVVRQAGYGGGRTSSFGSTARGGRNGH